MTLKLQTTSCKDERPLLAYIAVDPLGDTVWNATYDCLRLGRELALKILNGEADADEFSFSPLAPEWVQKWGQSSPFDVQLIGLELLFNLAD